MKVETNIEEKKFTPVELKITFENQIEFDVFKHMIGMNATIPELLAKDSNFMCENENTLDVLMMKIFNKLNEVKKITI